MSWQEEDNIDIIKKFILFTISPLLGFVASLRRINTKSSFIVFFLVSIFFGLNFTTANGRDEKHTGDSTQYRFFFEHSKYMSTEELIDDIYEFSTFQSNEIRDIYVITMIYISSRISSSYHVFFAILAVVFAFFMLKSLRFFTDELSPQYGFPVLILLYIFTLISIFNINGCRFWTAYWVAVYCIFHLFLNNNKRYLLLAFITPLIHQSYWFFLALLLIMFLSGKKYKFWKIAFIFSFIFSSFAMELVVDISQYLPPSLQFLVERYTENGEHIPQTNLYQVIRRIFGWANIILSLYMMLLLFKNEDIIKSNEKTRRLYPALLIIMSASQFLMPIPSLGGRYIALSYPLLAYIWYQIFESKTLYRNVIYLYPLCNLMPIYENIMCYVMYSVPLSFYYTSPLYQFYKYLILGVI